MKPDAIEWQLSEKGEVAQNVLTYVAELERLQADTFDRFEKLACLYDPYRRAYSFDEEIQREARAKLQENLIASNCDAITGSIAAAEIRPRFMTDDADWSTQRRAHKLELYAEGLAKQLKLHELKTKACHAGALKGTDLAHIYVDAWGRICAEAVMVDDIVVDDQEARGGQLQQMHRRRIVPRNRLIAQFPQYEEEIKRAQSRHFVGGGVWRYWADYRPLGRHDVVVIESWYLPFGCMDEEGYQPGRHTIVIDGCDLHDEEWHEHRFPFAVFRWLERRDGWYGIGGAERLIGHQRILNKLNWQMDRQLDQHAVPTTYVRVQDAALAVRSVTRAGSVVPYKMDLPHTVIPPAVSPEVYKRREDIRASGYEEFGQSRMSATAMKPPGLDSGIALREYKDQTTQRFATQEQALERFYLDCIWLALRCCKQIAEAGGEPPVVQRITKYSKRIIRWRDVDMDEVEVQLIAASSVSRTPAGRLQLVMEFAQAGVISQDEARRLMRHPDVERAMSLYTASLEHVEAQLEAMLDGEPVSPSPYQNLQIALWRGTAQLEIAQMDGAPDDVLELLFDYVTLAAYMLSLAAQPAQPTAPPAPEEMAGQGMEGGMGMGNAGAEGTAMTGAGVMPMQLAG